MTGLSGHSAQESAACVAVGLHTANVLRTLPNLYARCQQQRWMRPVPPYRGAHCSVVCDHSLVVRTPRRGRGNPGSIPGDRFAGSIPSDRLRRAKMDTEGFEPSTSRMRNGRSSTELSAHIAAGTWVMGAQSVYAFWRFKSTANCGIEPLWIVMPANRIAARNQHQFVSPSRGSACGSNRGLVA